MILKKERGSRTRWGAVFWDARIVFHSQDAAQVVSDDSGIRPIEQMKLLWVLPLLIPPSIPCYHQQEKVRRSRHTPYQPASSQRPAGHEIGGRSFQG